LHAKKANLQTALTIVTNDHTRCWNWRHIFETTWHEAQLILWESFTLETHSGRGFPLVHTISFERKQQWIQNSVYQKPCLCECLWVCELLRKGQ